jgi:acyl-CoA dehydrogenase
MTFDLHVQTLGGLAGGGTDQRVAELWDEAERLGYVTATLPSELDGGDGSLEDGADIARAAGHVLYGAPVAQAAMLLGPLLGAAGWKLGEGVATAVVDPRGSRGSLPVDFGAAATSVYVVSPSGDESRLVELGLEGPGVGRGNGRAAEPSHVARIDPNTAPVLREVGLEQPHEHWLALAALAAAVQIDGAVKALVYRTVDYLGTRTQFGRPLMEFQALQHRIAELATLSELLTHAVDEAVRRWSAADGGRVRAAVVAKIEAGQVGLLAAAEAHQLHGAIGYTEEAGLGEFSKLIWSQDGRAGSRDWWSAWLGDHDRRTDLWSESATLGASSEGERP